MTRGATHEIPAALARRLWLRAQRLDESDPFGTGPEATRAAIAHLGYVQIDTINVIERCHHHILFTRIPGYQRSDLAHAQSVDKSVFEYWTHALSYVPTADLPHFLADMRRQRQNVDRWFGSVTPDEVRKVMRRIRQDGPLSIRDIDDDVLVDKDHPWASRKPSKRALQFGFYTGDLTVSARTQMVKTYDLSHRHFGWPPRPKPASEAATARYLLERALRSQGIVTLESACYLVARRKAAVAQAVERLVRRGELVPVTISGSAKQAGWVRAEALETVSPPSAELVHILSPFDPLVIQRGRLMRMFGYEHRFEAYVPKEKRRYGYFALPVLIGDRIVAAIDLKADRSEQRLLVNKWNWLPEADRRHDKAAIETALDRFAKFQFA